MRFQGLRAQLSFWYAGSMTMTLLFLSLFAYVLLSQVLHSRADAALRDYADATARRIAMSLYQQTTSTDPPARSQFLTNDLRGWGRYIQVIDPQGYIVEKSDGLSTHPLPVSSAALRRGLAGQSTFETAPGLGEHPVRIVTLPVRLGDRVPYLVQAGTSLEGLEDALKRAAWILAILTPMVLVVSLVGGWLVLDGALRRVDALTKMALEIQSSNLQRRIEHTGPDDEIGRLARAFDRMITRLDRSFRQIRQFSADASHELKTPLTAIRGEAEVALMGDLSVDEARRTLRSILESSERVSEVVDRLLLLARADAGESLIRREAVSLSDVLLQAYETLEDTGRRQGVMLILDRVEDVMVSGDPLWLSQVALNLISNGIKYTPPGGTVTLALRLAGTYARLEVADTGVGIAEEHLPRIFDRFYRIDHGRTRAAGGAGLGLNITRWAVEAHGGRIEVESRVGAGSIFQVWLPLLAAAPMPLTEETREAVISTSG